MKLNRIVTKRTNKGFRIGRDEKGFFVEPIINVKTLLEILTENSAVKVLIPAWAIHDSRFDDTIKNLPKIYRDRLMLIDKDEKILNISEQFTNAVQDDIIHTFFSNQDVIHKLSKSKDYPYYKHLIKIKEGGGFEMWDHPSTIQSFIQMINFGCKYKAEIDLEGYNNLKPSLLLLKNLVTDDEIKSKIVLLLGIVNCYEIKNVNRLEFKKELNLYVYKQIKELYDSIEFEELSKNRNDLGYADHIKYAILKLKSQCQKITNQEKYNKIINLGLGAVNVASNNKISKIRKEISRDLISYGKFNPPIVDLSYLFDNYD